MTEFLRDMRFGLRLLARSPVFTATAVLLVAIGISANTLIFSVVDAVLLRRLPVSHPENLVRLVELHPTNFVTWELPYGFCDAMADRGAADFSAVFCEGEANLAFSDGASTERERVHLVSPNFFASLGVRAHLGRVLTPDDERTRAMNAVLSYDFWERRFRRDPAILGRSFTLHGYAFTIVGVLPRGFNGLTVDTSPDIRVPASLASLLIDPSAESKSKVPPLFAQIFARLRPGVSRERADGELDPLLRAAYEDLLEQFFPEMKASGPKRAMDNHLRLQPIPNGVSVLRSQFSRGLEMLMAGVGLLLIMACANVAGLLVARSAARAQEIGVRLALGASPGRVARQLFTESLALAILGGIAGTLLTYACLPLLVRALPPIRDRAAVVQPLAVHIDIDLRVLAFTLAVTLLTAVLFGLLPALQGARADLAGTLRSARTATRRLFTRNAVVVAQVALCTLILIGAALLVETLDRMRSMNAGFDRDHVVTFTVDPSLREYNPEQSRALSRKFLETARVLPSVAAASIADRAVMRGTGIKATFGVAGTRIDKNDFLNASMNDVTPGYFETMGMRLLAGREFTWFDQNKKPNPSKAIVNQAFVHRFFAGKDSIGGRFGYAGPNGLAKADNEIVGVVSDAKYRSLREPIPPTVYYPVVNGFSSDFILHLRTRGQPESIVGPVRDALHALDPQLPFIEVRTLREEVETSLWQERLLAALSSIFGAIAALLASIGLYGALDYAVKSRTREIGVRVALGAEPARIVRLLSRETLLLIAAGVAVGLCSYAAAALWIRQVLYGVQPWDAIALGAAVLGIVATAILAVTPPIWRGIHVDPAAALRVE
jgi:predicted permease